jgi:hypothetical protein
VNHLRRQFRSFSWIALLAIFGLALAPTISRALVHAQGGSSAWAEVCTPQGTKRVSASLTGEASTPAPATSSAAHLDHCPLCGLAAAAFAPPPAPAGLPLVLGPESLTPALFLHAPAPQFAWAAPPLRGPPALS